MTWFDPMSEAALCRRFLPQQDPVPEIETWARVVGRETPLPEALAGALAERGHHDCDTSYVIFQPADQWGSRHTAPYLVAWDGSNLDIITQRGPSAEAERFPVASIDTIQRGRMLLYSWLRINAVLGGRRITRVFEFNTVVEAIFNRLINSVRKARTGFEPEHAHRMKPALPSLGAGDRHARRLLAYASGSLLCGEQVISMHTCSAEGKPLRIGGRFRGRTHIPGPYIIVLTSHEVIEIHEEWRSPAQPVRYGAVWEFLPLS